MTSNIVCVSLSLVLDSMQGEEKDTHTEGKSSVRQEKKLQLPSELTPTHQLIDFFPVHPVTCIDEISVQDVHSLCQCK